MTTFKTCVKTQRSDGLFAVLIRITHNRTAKYINTGKTIDKSKVRKGEIKDATILSYCSNLIKLYSERLNAVEITTWTANEVVSYLQNIDEDISFSKYARKYERDMAVNRGMERNSRNYKWAYQSLEKYAGTNDIKFSKMTTKFIQDWMKTLEKTSRAKEMYPICIRMMYNAAMEEYNDYDKNIIRIKLQPFRKIAIPKADVPEKRAVSLDLLKIFFTGTLPETKLKASLPELSRDVAEMVFCLAGMNTADIFELRKSNLKNGVFKDDYKNTLYGKVSIEELMGIAGYVEGDENSHANPVILHKDNDYTNNVSGNLEWVDESDPRYTKYYNETAKKLNALGREYNKNWPQWMDWKLKDEVPEE